MDYEKIAVNGATTAYAAAVQAHIAAQEFYIEMWQTDLNSLPGDMYDTILAKAVAVAHYAHMHMDMSEKRLAIFIGKLGGWL